MAGDKSTPNERLGRGRGWGRVGRRREEGQRIGAETGRKTVAEDDGEGGINTEWLK